MSRGDGPGVVTVARTADGPRWAAARAAREERTAPVAPARDGTRVGAPSAPAEPVDRPPDDGPPGRSAVVAVPGGDLRAAPARPPCGWPAPGPDSGWWGWRWAW